MYMIFKTKLILLFKKQNKNGLHQTLLFLGIEELNITWVSQAGFGFEAGCDYKCWHIIFNNASFHCFKYIHQKAIKVQHTVTALFCNINYGFFLSFLPFSFLFTVVKHFKTPCSLILWKCWKDLSPEFCSSCKRNALDEVWFQLISQWRKAKPRCDRDCRGRKVLVLRDLASLFFGGSGIPAPCMVKCWSGQGPGQGCTLQSWRWECHSRRFPACLIFGIVLHHFLHVKKSLG